MADPLTTSPAAPKVPPTRYSQLKARLENNRWVAVILVASAALTGTAAVVRNLDSVGRFFRKSEPAVDTPARNLAAASVEVRVVGANQLGRTGAKTKAGAIKSIPVLIAFLNGEHALAHPRQPQERSDVVAALQALGAILATADTKYWAIKRPTLTKLDFSGLDLSGLYLSGVVVSDTLFVETVLVAANFSAATFTAVRFERAQAQNSIFQSAHIIGSCLEEVDLTGANLRLVESRDSDFNAAVFTKADLSGALFLNTRLADTDLDDSQLSGTDLRGALQLVRGQLDRARGAASAMLPDPLYSPSRLAVCRPPT